MDTPSCEIGYPYPQRGNRDIRVESILGKEPASQVRAGKVAVVGVGAVGGQILPHLAMLGVGKILLLDHGFVEPENLGNQGFDASHIGMLKVSARKAQIERINPACHVETFPKRLEEVGWGLFFGYDLVMCALDNLGGRILLNEICMRVQVPWVDGAVDGSGQRMFGRVGSYSSHPDAPCYICSFDRRQLAEAMAAERQGCPSWRKESTPSRPTLSVSPECAVIAGLQCVEAIKRLTGAVTSDFCTELVVDLDSCRMMPLTLRRNPHCLNFHKGFVNPQPLPRDISIGAVLDLLESDGTAKAQIRLHRRTFISRIHCMACGKEVQIGRIDVSWTKENGCCDCGSALMPTPHARVDTLDRENAAAFLSSTWEDIGLPVCEVVTGCCRETETHFVIG